MISHLGRLSFGLFIEYLVIYILNWKSKVDAILSKVGKNAHLFALDDLDLYLAVVVDDGYLNDDSTIYQHWKIKPT